MSIVRLILFTGFLILTLEVLPSSQGRFNRRASNQTLKRFRRREFVQEEVRKNMLTYMTSLKGEITDVVLDEIIAYYNTQTSKLYRLEKEMTYLKNSSLPMVGNNSIRLNDLVRRMSEQQQSFASNVSQMELKLQNLTSTLNDLLKELQQQQKPVEHVRRLVTSKKEFDAHDIPTDCDDVLRQQPDLTEPGIFRIKPRAGSEAFDVLCIFENQKGENHDEGVEIEGRAFPLRYSIGWIVFQRRFNGSVDFYRDWNAYKHGFGDLRSEFWLGNEKIHQLTSEGEHILRVDLQPWDSGVRLAEYGHFALENENENYRMQVSDFHSNISTAGDSLRTPWLNSSAAQFSTYDRDHDHLFYDNCALTYQGAWWFTSCFQSHLNGIYVRSPLALHNTARNGLHWNSHSLYHSMKATTMRIRRRGR